MIKLFEVIAAGAILMFGFVICIFTIGKSACHSIDKKMDKLLDKLIGL